MIEAGMGTMIWNLHLRKKAVNCSSLFSALFILIMVIRILRMCMQPKANDSAGREKKRKGLSLLVKKKKKYSEPPFIRHLSRFLITRLTHLLFYSEIC